MTVISLIGPTAVGKTDLALWLAVRLIEEKKCSQVEIISADSRQVYQGLELLSGADLPETFVQQSDTKKFPYRFFASTGNQIIRVHGISIIKPSEDWSVSHFNQLFAAVVDQAQAAGAICIVVGGTGLYHSHKSSHDSQLFVPPNVALRASLEELDVETLQSQLKAGDQVKFDSMNHSDQCNPRRLIRAIEVLQAGGVATEPQASLQTSELSEVSSFQSQLVIGVTAPLDVLSERIRARVEKRLQQGAQGEVERLMHSDASPKSPAFSATGVRELIALNEGLIEREECVLRWARREVQYAKRQLTWWKKYAAATWFEIPDLGVREQIWNLVNSAVES